MGVAVLDANFILRYMLGDVPDQTAAAARVVNQITSGEVTARVPEFVLAECIFVLSRSYGLPRSRIAGWFRQFLDLKGMQSAQNELMLDAVSIFEVSNFSIVDALLAAQIKLEGGELFSFDKQLLKYVTTR